MTQQIFEMIPRVQIYSHFRTLSRVKCDKVIL